jgi:hypothetical protein
MYPRSQWPCLPTNDPENWGVGRIELFPAVDLQGCAPALVRQAGELRLFRSYLRFAVGPIEDEATVGYECRGFVRLTASATETAGTPGAIQFFALPLFPDVSPEAAPTTPFRTAIEAALARAVPEAKAPHIERVARYRSVVVREWLGEGRGVDLERVAEWLVDPDATRVLLRPDDIRGGAPPLGGDRQPVCGDRWLDFASEPGQEGRSILRRVTVAGGEPETQRAFEAALLEAVRRRLADVAAGEDAAALEDARVFERIQQRQGSSLIPPSRQHASISVRVDPHGVGVSEQSFIFDVDDLLFRGLDFSVAISPPGGTAQVELTVRPVEPLDPTTVGAVRSRPFAFDFRVVYGGVAQTRHVVGAADLALEHGHGMLATLPLQETFTLNASRPGAAPVALHVSGVAPTLPPGDPAW